MDRAEDPTSQTNGDARSAAGTFVRGLITSRAYVPANTHSNKLTAPDSAVHATTRTR